MANNRWSNLIDDVFSGRARSPTPSPPSAPRAAPSNTRSYTEAQGQAQARANRMREMEAAIQRTQAARPSRPLTAVEIAAVRRRYE